MPPSAPSPNRLLINQGPANPGHFLDVTTTSGTNSSIAGFTTRFNDFDRDGDPDIALAADFGNRRYYLNDGNALFTDATTTHTDNFRGRTDMGSTSGDYNRDGRIDYFNSLIQKGDIDIHGGNRLMRNDGGGVFSEHATAASVRDGGWGWGTSWIDYDNNGALDLVLTNGWPQNAGDNFSTDPTILWENNGNGATFTEIQNTVGITDTREGRGLLVFDFDNDGDQDIFIVHNGEHPVLYRNDGGSDNDYLRIDTVGTMSNRDGIGAFITLIPDLTQSSNSNGA